MPTPPLPDAVLMEAVEAVSKHGCHLPASRAARGAAAWFWTDRKIGPLADANDIEAVTRKINGGTHGLDDRRRYLQTAMRVLS